ncbi:MAG: ABC-ATPase domain-containing protein [Lachnospiraceae bacterium]|nr:ABC-ATPase domain-containing protein [Lachnospiraceae bacterium]MDY5521887.1 ABC-ATPase domain-containing protein [Agathobacter sp.]
MQSSRELQNQLRSIDHKSYPAYKALRGSYQFDGYQLNIDHVQGDPFAAPSHVSVFVPASVAAFPEYAVKNDLTRQALSDFLARQFAKQVNQYTFKAKGSGKSGLISVTQCGQEVLYRTACEVTNKGITARFAVGFPANGRTINARELEKILFEYLPVCVTQAFSYKNLNAKAVQAAVELTEDQDYIRKQLDSMGLVAFVADHAVLPRESGISSKPMKNSVEFESPESLRVSMELPHKGTITGMGIPKGITLIVGGGYHGKSTLLTALELGVYNHIAGDGREYVITDESALKMRSEDGRFIKDVDISMFINDLPNKKDTRCFSTEDASGSTSQAAGIIEGMEAGSRVFLLDEDTSATNFMVRDAFMQRVVSPDKEPITPFLSRARALYEQAGISTILVAGSSGAFFHIADTVIQMDNYRPVDITEKAKALCASFPISEEMPTPFSMPQSHRIMTKDANGATRRRDYRTGAVKKDEPERLKVKVMGRDGFALGKQNVDLRYIEQLIDTEQTAALGIMLKYAVEKLIDGKRTLSDIAEYMITQMQKKGLSFFAEGSYIPGGYAMPRPQEIYACLNRYRRA